MELSIVIPTYNEKENIQILLRKIYQEFKKHKIKGEIIVIDDNSPDNTGKVTESLKKNTIIFKLFIEKGSLVCLLLF